MSLSKSSPIERMMTPATECKVLAEETFLDAIAQSMRERTWDQGDTEGDT